MLCSCISKNNISATFTTELGIDFSDFYIALWCLINWDVFSQFSAKKLLIINKNCLLSGQKKNGTEFKDKNHFTLPHFPLPTAGVLHSQCRVLQCCRAFLTRVLERELGDSLNDLPLMVNVRNQGKVRKSSLQSKRWEEKMDKIDPSFQDEIYLRQSLSNLV